MINLYNNALNNPFKTLRENLSLIVIIPTLLGGIWQIIELISIDFAFIRFFSISQMVPDGLLILFLTFTIILIGIPIYFIGKILLRYIIMREFFKSSLSRNEGSDIFFMILILLFSICSFFYASNNFANRKFSFLSSKYFLFYAIPIYIFLIMGLNFQVIFFKKFQKTKIIMIQKCVKFLFVLSSIFFVFSLIIRPFNIALSRLKYTDNFINLKKEFDHKLYKIEYFNDKFIFVRYIDSNKINTRIIPFEKLTDDTISKQ